MSIELAKQSQEHGRAMFRHNRITELTQLFFGQVLAGTLDFSLLNRAPEGSTYGHETARERQEVVKRALTYAIEAATQFDEFANRTPLPDLERKSTGLQAMLQDVMKEKLK